MEVVTIEIDFPPAPRLHQLAGAGVIELGPVASVLGAHAGLRRQSLQARQWTEAKPMAQSPQIVSQGFKPQHKIHPGPALQLIEGVIAIQGLGGDAAHHPAEPTAGTLAAHILSKQAPLLVKRQALHALLATAPEEVRHGLVPWVAAEADHPIAAMPAAEIVVGMPERGMGLDPPGIAIAGEKQGPGNTNTRRDRAHLLLLRPQGRGQIAGPEMGGKRQFHRATRRLAGFHQDETVAITDDHGQPSASLDLAAVTETPITHGPQKGHSGVQRSGRNRQCRRLRAHPHTRPQPPCAL